MCVWMLTLCSMTFRTRNSSKSTIKIPATLDICDSFLDVQFVKLSEKRESIDRTIQEACIGFAKGVARKNSRRLLQR